MTVKIRALKPGSVFKYLAVSFLTFYLLLCLFFGILAMAGCNTVHWNRQPVHGLAALPFSLLIATMMWVFSTVFTWIAVMVGFTVSQEFFPVELEAQTDYPPPQVTGPNP